MDRDVVIVGGGIAGLAAAVFRSEQGLDVEVLEAATEVGGHLRARRADGHVFARGPHAFPSASATLVALAAAAGALERARPVAGDGARFVFRNGRLWPAPRGAAGLLASPLLSARGKLRLMAEPLRRRPSRRDEEESVADFFHRRIGREASAALVGPLVAGIHAGDPAQLEVRSAFPRLVEWEERHGSLLAGALRSRGRSGSLLSFPGGLGVLAECCVDLIGRGRVLTGAPVERLEREGSAWRVVSAAGDRRASEVVLAVPAPEAARLLAPLQAEASRLASLVPHAPIAVVHLGRPGPSGLSGFGTLVAREERLATLGIVFVSSLFPDRAPAGAWLQASVLGGAAAPEILRKSDDELRALAAREARLVLGFDPDGGTCDVVRHPAGIPQLVRGHAARIRELRRRVQALPGLSLAGNWLDGVSLEDAARSARPAGEVTRRAALAAASA